MKISVDAEYLEELEEKAKRHDFFEGYIKGIEVAFAFAEELVKDIGNRKTENCSEKPNDSDEPQTETEIAKAIVHKMIDDAVIAEDAYPDLRQKMHDAVDEYEPQTERSE